MKVFKSILGFLLLFGNCCALTGCFYISYVSIIGTKQIENEIFILEDQSRPKFSELLLVIGVLIPVFCFLNCLIFVVNSVLFFSLFSSMMIMLLVLQALIFFFFHPNIENLKTTFENKVMDLIEDAGDSFALHSLQEKYNCCGFDAFTDWLKKNKEIPGSCCKRKFHKTCLLDLMINVHGCRQIIYKQIEQTAAYLPHVFSLIFIFEVILFVTSVSIVINFESSESQNQLLPTTKETNLENSESQNQLPPMKKEKNLETSESRNQLPPMTKEKNFESSESQNQLPPMTKQTFDSSAEGGIHFEESVDTHG